LKINSRIQDLSKKSKKDLQSSKAFNKEFLFYLSEMSKKLKSSEIIQTIEMVGHSQQYQLILTKPQTKKIVPSKSIIFLHDHDKLNRTV
jgi:hypothetical protein